LHTLRGPIEAYKWFKSAVEQGEKEKEQMLVTLASTLLPGELQEDDRHYREFKATH
jgi:hypothetical protein